jgi:hypothetical protein
VSGCRTCSTLGLHVPADWAADHPSALHFFPWQGLLLEAQLRLQIFQDAQEFHLRRGASVPNTNCANVSAAVLVGFSGVARGRGGAVTGPAVASSPQLSAAGVEPGAQEDQEGRPEGICEKDQEGSPDVRWSCRHVLQVAPAPSSRKTLETRVGVLKIVAVKIQVVRSS